MAGKAGRRVYRTKAWQATRLRVFKRDGWRCRSCGKPGVLECDHIRPIAKEGDWFDMRNLQALCRGCHIRKSRRERMNSERAELMEMAFNA